MPICATTLWFCSGKMFENFSASRISAWEGAASVSQEIGSSTAGASGRWKQVFVAIKCLYSEDAPGPDLNDVPRFCYTCHWTWSISGQPKQISQHCKRRKKKDRERSLIGIEVIAGAG